ncbi:MULTISPECIES: RNA polymerase sigma factor [Streptomyces]|uniref:Zinc-finger domain-containing protein n=1 Tax=Streptomyces koelreuteriae TaxID=2838015 RepID=A0ABX8G1I9_9ACTN|nr:MULTISPECIES: hypothetical protein [Streptomyces]QWB27221.1 hypothetical protein KJK29_34065 [Streptomyces koelreuteriae]UUA10305.1 hypothetical protein NNW98_34260 [Streptomyces koelreuteriae]UUA17912.1 hypothetical protein NNW99_34145 [Streptomyces sp. CRCS-T-1]
MLWNSGSQPQELSDAELLQRVSDGAPDAFGVLQRRHERAAWAYASTCLKSPGDAQAVTAYALTGLRLRIGRAETGESCVRVSILNSIRGVAIQWAALNPTMLTPSFGRWVGGGAVWSLTEDAELRSAFEELPGTDQCLLWHSIVEGDSPATVGGIVGIPAGGVSEYVAQAVHSLRRGCAERYASRLDREDCLGFVNAVVFGSAESWADAADTTHLRECPECREVFWELRNLSVRLPARLPQRLLGWWPADAYRSAKYEVAGATAPVSAAARRTRGAFPRVARSGRRRRARPPGYWYVAALGFLLVLVAFGLYALAAKRP